MKLLLKIIGLGLALWVASLLWLDINRVLMWPLFVGFMAGLTPAYLVGQFVNRRHQGRPAGRVIRRPRSVTVPSRPNLSTQPTRPSPVVPRPRRERPASPTYPMPVI